MAWYNLVPAALCACIAQARGHADELALLGLLGAGHEHRLGDSYGIGTSGQWKDVTNLTAGNGTLTIVENAWNMLCEGIEQCDAADPTQKLFNTSRADVTGDPWVCRHPPADGNVAANNVGSTTQPHYGCGKGYVTQPSPYGEAQEIGPLHDSDFALLGGVQLRQCPLGKTMVLNCTLPAHKKSLRSVTDSQVVRVCESSKVLGCGTACRAMQGGHNNEGAKAQLVVTPENPVAYTTFACPGPRGTQGVTGYEPGGYYSLYASMLVPLVGGDAPSVACSVSAM